MGTHSLSFDNRRDLKGLFWGKSHMKLRADTQFVRFSFNGRARLFTLNNIEADEKELKMLTKGRCEDTIYKVGGSNETIYYCSWPS